MMKYLVLITILVLSGGPTYAEWVELLNSADLNVVLYIDTESIRRKDNLVKLWLLADLKTTKTTGDFTYLSSKNQYEFDCVEERMRVLAGVKYSSNMGRGSPVDRFSVASDWAPPAPGTLGESLWNFACGKK